MNRTVLPVAEHSTSSVSASARVMKRPNPPGRSVFGVVVDRAKATAFVPHRPRDAGRIDTHLEFDGLGRRTAAVADGVGDQFTHDQFDLVDALGIRPGVQDVGEPPGDRDRSRIGRET